MKQPSAAMKFKITFPFAVTQTANNEITLSHENANGVRLPHLEPQGDQAEAFDRTFGVDMSVHEAIIDRLNEDYHQRLILATAKVRFACE